MSRLTRLSALERATAKTLRGPYVLIRPGQSKQEALREAGLPADAPNDFLLVEREGQ